MFNSSTEVLDNIIEQNNKFIDETMDSIESMLPGVEEHNPGLIDKMLEILQS